MDKTEIETEIKQIAIILEKYMKNGVPQQQLPKINLMCGDVDVKLNIDK